MVGFAAVHGWWILGESCASGFVFSAGGFSGGFLRRKVWQAEIIITHDDTVLNSSSPSEKAPHPSAPSEPALPLQARGRPVMVFSAPSSSYFSKKATWSYALSPGCRKPVPLSTMASKQCGQSGNTRTCTMTRTCSQQEIPESAQTRTPSRNNKADRPALMRCPFKQQLFVECLSEFSFCLCRSKGPVRTFHYEHLFPGLPSYCFFWVPLLPFRDPRQDDIVYEKSTQMTRMHMRN